MKTKGEIKTMGKYDCTKARDFLHEMSRMDEWCKNGKMCDDCVDNKTGYDRCPLCVTIDKWKIISDNDFSKIVECLQNWSDSHPEMRELTGDEIAVLSGLKLLGFKHIAADKDKMVWAYTEMPEKDIRYWTNRGVGSSICISYTGLFVGIADFSDEKPLVIDEILNERK